MAVDYALTTVALPFNGVLVKPNSEPGWTLKETKLRETSVSQNVTNPMTPGTMTSNWSSKCHELLCFWVRVPEQVKPKGEESEWN